MTDSNKTLPAVSIIMPVYNAAAYISDTISSVRNQTYNNWELIIIDDGSDDGTPGIIEQVHDERIVCYRQTHSGIISKMRQLGIEKALGELIAFIDSDDLWAETKLQEQVMALQQNKQAGFCVTGGYNFIEPGQPLDFFYRQSDGVKYGDLFPLFFQSELAVYLQALVFRKSCMAIASPFNETDNDIDFMLRLAKNYKGLIIYEPLFFRRIHSGNYSNLNWKRNYMKGIRALQFYASDTKPGVIKNAFFRLYINYGEDCLKHGERREAVQLFLKAWKYKPTSIVPFKKAAKSMFSTFKNSR